MAEQQHTPWDGEEFISEFDVPFEVLTADALRKDRDKAMGALEDLHDFLRTVRQDDAFANLVAQHMGEHEDDVANRNILLLAADCRAELETLFVLSMRQETGPVRDGDGEPTLSEVLDETPDGDLDEHDPRYEAMRCAGCGRVTGGVTDQRCLEHLCTTCWASVLDERYGTS